MRILISDYSATARTVLKAALIKFGYSVEVVSDGDTALVKLTDPQGPKVAILDSNLPRLDGFGLCRRLGSEKPDSRRWVMLLTSEKDRTEVLSALEAGADDYLQKPFDSIDLKARLCIAERTLKERKKHEETLAQQAGNENPVESTPALAKEPEAKKEEAPPAPPEPDEPIAAPEEAAEKQDAGIGFPDPNSLRYAALSGLPPMRSIEPIVSKVFADMGLGEALSVESGIMMPDQEFCTMSVIMVPQKTLGLDIVIDMDRASAQSIYAALTGETDAPIESLMDIVGETLNMVQGSIKGALQDEHFEVYTPVTPLHVNGERKQLFSTLTHEYIQHVFSVGDARLRVTLVPRQAPVVSKKPGDVRAYDVVVEPVKLPGNPKLILWQKGTVMNKRHMEKLREFSAEVSTEISFDIVEIPHLQGILP